MKEEYEEIVDKEFEKKYKKAKKRVKEIKAFYSHLITFVLINMVLFMINMLTSPSFWWFIFPLLGWGISLISHWISVYGIKFGKEWEERKIRKIMAEDEDW